MSKTISNLLRHPPVCAYSGDKQAFHRAARAYLRELAKLAGLPKGSYQIHSCMGGPAVPGEETLHGEFAYVEIGGSFNGEQPVLYRSCQGRKDYTGGTNRWWPWYRLTDIRDFADNVRRLGDNAQPGQVTHVAVRITTKTEDT